MMRKLTFFTCFAVIIWIGGQTQDPGAQQSADSQEGVAQSRKDTPDFADVAAVFNQRCSFLFSSIRVVR